MNIIYPKLLVNFLLCTLGLGCCLRVIAQEVGALEAPSDSLGSQQTPIQRGFGIDIPLAINGNACVLNERDFNQGLIGSSFELLNGKIPGISIVSEDGAPGSSFQLQSLSLLSFTEKKSPLILIDGIPQADGHLALNPADIASFTFLGNSAGAGIYGERGSAGVLIISTKKGGGKLKVNYTGKSAISSMPRSYEVFSAADFRALVQERFPGDSAALSHLGNASTDWQKEVYRTVFSHDHQLGLSGSIKNIPYRASIGYINQQGIMRTTGYDRTSGILTLDPELFDKHLKLLFNARGVNSNTSLADPRIVYSAISFNPTQPVYDSDNPGDFFHYTWPDGSPIKLAPANPVALLSQTKFWETLRQTALDGQFDYSLHFFPNIHVIAMAGYDRTKNISRKDVDASASWTYDPIYGSGKKERQRIDRESRFLTTFLDFSPTMGSLNTRLKLTVGYEYQQISNKTAGYNTNVDGSRIDSDSHSTTEDRFAAWFSRAHLSLKDKYFFTMNMRSDGSSQFAADNRWGFSPSAAFTWDIRRESFFHSTRIISGLKIRASYGVTGSLKRYTGFNGNQLRHERVAITDIGLDYSLIESRVNGSIDYYQKNGDDLILVIPIASGSGLSDYIIGNGGGIENHGIEGSLFVKLFTTNTFRWTIGTEFTRNKNKISRLGTSIQDYLGLPNGAVQIQTFGYPLNTFYVFQQVYDPSGKPIEGLYVDRNKNGYFDWRDQYRYQKPDPGFVLGISSMLAYRSWAFSFSGRLCTGNFVYNNGSVINGNYANLYNSGLQYFSNLLRSVDDCKFNSYQPWSNYYVENGAFFRMEYMRFEHWFDDLIPGAGGFAVSLCLQNAFLITSYSGIDPEVTNGIDIYPYPRARTLSLEVKLDL